MTMLVTGSAGHLGEGLMRTLRAAGRRARGIDIKPSPFTDAVGSICDRDFVRQTMSGMRAVIHTATLHKPHIATHPVHDFIATNVTGTSILLEEAAAAQVAAFVLTSTTSVFGLAMTPGAGEPAAWITEDVVPVPKNIYGITKIAAESLCELAFRDRGLAVIVLRTARFFPEADDNAGIRTAFEPANAQVNELLNRRADIADVVGAHLLAVERAPAVGFGRYIISATTPFAPEDRLALRRDPRAVVFRLFPRCEALYAARRWSLFPEFDRVYVNDRARTELGWRPAYDFAHALDRLQRGQDFRSALAREVGAKGYHDRSFGDQPYPVDSKPVFC